MAYRVLVSQPGIEPITPAVKVQSLNHWTELRKSLDLKVAPHFNTKLHK